MDESHLNILIEMYYHPELQITTQKMSQIKSEISVSSSRFSIR